MLQGRTARGKERHWVSAVAHDKMEVRLQVGGQGDRGGAAACVAKRVDLSECFDTP